MPFPVSRLIAAWSLAHFGYRAAVIALPLLALQETGSAWTVGLVAGAAGLPTIVAPWWTRGLHRRIGSAHALGALLAVEGVATLVVPVSAACDVLSPAVMVVTGLAVGALNAVSGPLDSALLAALGDRRDTEHGAAQVLAVQDTSVRVAMTLAPLATLPLIALVGTAATVAGEGVLSLLGALLVVTLRVRAHDVAEAEVPRLSGLLGRHPDIRRGWIVRGVGCAGWFAFTLGLVVIGHDTGHGALLATVGLTAYSAGAVVGSAGGVLAARSSIPALLNSGAWLVAGIGWVVMGLDPSPLVVGATAVVMGLAVPAGNAATTTMVTRATAGLERRTALTAQATVVTGSSALGSLVGGPLIAWFGPRPTLVAVGVAVGMVSCVVALSTLNAGRGRGVAEVVRSAARQGDDERGTGRLVEVGDGATDRLGEPTSQGEAETCTRAVGVS